MEKRPVSELSKGISDSDKETYPKGQGDFGMSWPTGSTSPASAGSGFQVGAEVIDGGLWVSGLSRPAVNGQCTRPHSPHRWGRRRLRAWEGCPSFSVGLGAAPVACVIQRVDMGLRCSHLGDTGKLKLATPPRFDPWVGKIPRRRKWQLRLVFLPGKSHCLVGYSPWGRKESDMTE